MASARDNRALFRSVSRKTCPTVGCKMWRARDFAVCARCLRSRAEVSDAANAGVFGLADDISFRITCAAIFKPFSGVLAVMQASRAISIERDCVRDADGKLQWAPGQRRYLLVDLNQGSRARLGAFFDQVDDIYTWFRDGNLFFNHDYFVVDPTVDAEMRFLFYSMEELPQADDYNPSTAWWSNKFRRLLQPTLEAAVVPVTNKKRARAVKEPTE